MIERISAQELKRKILSREEFAVIDVREEGVYFQNHLLWASNIPLSRLEFLTARLLPRKTRLSSSTMADRKEKNLRRSMLRAALQKSDIRRLKFSPGEHRAGSKLAASYFRDSMSQARHLENFFSNSANRPKSSLQSCMSACRRQTI